MRQEIALQRARPRTVEQARRDIEESRERMADTLGEIEHRLLTKKQQIEDRMDVLRPVKERVRSKPWVSLAVAFGVGAVLWKLKHREE